MNKRKYSQMYSITYTNPNGTYNPKISNTEPYSKYVPFNYIQVKNMTDADLDLYLNSNKFQTVPAGTIMSADGNNVPAIRNIYFIITSATGNVELNIQKMKTINESINQAFVRGL